MAALSGKDGKILIGAEEIGQIRGWSFTASSANPQYASSQSGGYRVSAAGVKSGRGRFRYALDPDDPLSEHLNEGDAVTLKLYVDATHFYTVPARIESVGVEVDIDDTSDVVGGPVEFTTNGAWTRPSFV